MTYRGYFSWVVTMVNFILIRGMGIGAISTVLKISITNVLQVHQSGKYVIRPKQTHYDCLEIDEFLTSVGKKKNNVRFIYTYTTLGKRMAITYRQK
jgi:hypothetical protein